MQDGREGQRNLEDGQRNGHQDGNHSKSEGHRSRVSVIIEDFTFLWFTLSMNTGILSIIMHELPYQFNGLGILSTIMFVFNIVLFAAMFTVLMLRCILYPRAIVKACSTNLTELVMMGAVPIAWFTIVAQVGLTASTATWGGHAWFLVAYVMWWVGTFVMCIVAITVIVVIAKTDIVNVESLNPSMVIPFVGTATDAVVGAILINYSHGVTARLAIPVIIVSYILAGIGFFAAGIIYAAYFIRLINHGLPPPPQTPGLVLLVGPCGQSAAAAQLLGTAASTYFGQYAKGTFLQASAGSTLRVVGVLLGLMFVGLGLLFAAFSIYIIVEAAVKRQHQYSLMWWSTIFPMATVNTAFIAFATDMDSPTFRVLSTIFLICLLIDYFLNWAFTLRDVFLGKLLNGKRSQRPANNNGNGDEREKEH
ncbi:hypothetical protein LTR36_009582 [Oleoguttula mirabilis]|uniref:C4-dicarboxylate transporter/malic acid transport protein n=1 Tax=Oleoguttula mirabilis TaxID=1507867 RepID=A0AAV9JUK3_9PEZI|nr:hypothetical protein LTR36_009582 [Oleoguttula mirabilis]